jgi:hypothetical protein
MTNGFLAFFIEWWWVPGLLTSLCWGLRSGTIFSRPDHPRWQYFYQFTSNFVGCFAGWCCLYALAVRASAAPDLRSLNGIDAALFLIALFGLTGHLVQALVGLMAAVETLATAIGRKLGG